MEKLTLSRKKFISDFAKVSTDVLAIIGVLALIYGAFSAVEQKIIDAIPNSDIVIRPTCEPYATSDVVYPDGKPAKVKLMGFTVRAEKDTNDLRFSIEDIDHIISWSLDTDSFSEEDTKAFLSALPKGKVQNKRIFGSFPRILKGTEVVFQFKGVTRDSFKCSSDWFNVSSANSNVFQLMYPDNYQIRGLQWKSPSLNKMLFWVITIPLAVYVIYLKYLLANRRTAKRKPANSDITQAETK